MDRDRTQLALEVDPQVKQILKDQPGFMWENLQKAVFQAYGGDALDSRSAIKTEIEQAKRERRNAIERKQEAEQEISRQEKRINRLNGRLEQLSDEQASLEEDLDSILDDMSELGMRVWPDHGKVRAVARMHFAGDHDGQTVVDTLKERSEERGLDLPDSQFTEQYGEI